MITILMYFWHSLVTYIPQENKELFFLNGFVAD